MVKKIKKELQHKRRGQKKQQQHPTKLKKRNKKFNNYQSHRKEKSATETSLLSGNEHYQHIDNIINNKKELREIVNELKNKYTQAKTYEQEIVKNREKFFQPISTDLRDLKETIKPTKLPTIKKENESFKLQPVKEQEISTPVSLSTTLHHIKSEKTVHEFDESDSDKEYEYEGLPTSTPNIKSKQKFKLPTHKKSFSVPFGVTFNSETQQYYMTFSKKPVEFTRDSIIVDGKRFIRTKGLYSLLTQKYVSKQKVKPNKLDITTYIYMLEFTGDLYESEKNSEYKTVRNYIKYIQPHFLRMTKSPIQLSKQPYISTGSDTDTDTELNKSLQFSAENYKNVPNILKQEPKNDNEDKNEQKGTGLLTELMWVNKKNNKIDYVYWNDPNELCARLKLLISSKQAGNNNPTINNEIQSIINELHEAHIIY